LVAKIVLIAFVLVDLKAGADFCELVTQESDDKGSLATCGEYTFPRGFMVPEFEKASFDMSPGEYTIVQTQFGYHIIEKIADVPARVVPFAEVQDTILAALAQENQVTLYKAFIDEQKATGDIQVFME